MIPNYSPRVQTVLKRIKADIGDRLEVVKTGTAYEGLLMPRTETGDSTSIVIKLDNGYNMGIRYGKGVKVKKLKKAAKKKKKGKPIAKSPSFDPGKKTIVVMGTGGTIASRIDYQTGGVIPATSAQDLIDSMPEIMKVANLKARVLLQVFSEDINTSDYSKIAKEIAKEIKNGADGVIITHGTDTMHYTAAALSFALQDLPVPVLLVGSQRSSDRGSSDAAMNMICAAKFIVESDFSGIAICMHGSPSDDYCNIIPGTKARKLHTSRRDAFRAINTKPLARAYPDGTIEITGKYQKKDKTRKTKVKEKFNAKVGLVKIYPGMSEKVLEAFKNHDGLIIEGTGLGHAPINSNKKMLAVLKKLAKKMPVVMTSQCINGRINMNVYSTGRNLKTAGVISAKDMVPETAFIKLSWLLANHRNKARELIGKNLVGEIKGRRDLEIGEEW